MGTGILSILIYKEPHQFFGQEYVGIAFYALNCVLFVVFLFATLARYIFYPWILARMLFHSTQVLYLGTIGISLATIINATVYMVVPATGHWAVTFSWVLWWIDVLLAVLAALIPFLMMHVHRFSLDKSTATWLMTVIPAIVCSGTGGVVASVLPAGDAVLTISISYVLWCIGETVAFLILAQYLRHITIFKLPTTEALVSAFVPVGPVGQGSFAIIQLGSVARTAFQQTNFGQSALSGEITYIISLLTGLLMWSFGLWLLIHGSIAIADQAYHNKFAFNMGLWSFIFPIGVWTAGTISLAQQIPSVIFSYLSVIFTIVVLILWIVITSLTVYHTVTAKISVAPCMSGLLERPKIPEDGDQPDLTEEDEQHPEAV